MLAWSRPSAGWRWLRRPGLRGQARRNHRRAGSADKTRLVHGAPACRMPYQRFAAPRTPEQIGDVRDKTGAGSGVFFNWVSTTIRRARTSSRMACQADERTGNLSEFPRSKADFQGWFAGAALAPAESALPPDGRGYPFSSNSTSRSARRFLKNILVSVCFAPSPHAKILAPQRGRRASRLGAPTPRGLTARLAGPVGSRRERWV